MSIKGQWRRESKVSQSEVADNWAQTFGNRCDYCCKRVCECEERERDDSPRDGRSPSDD